MEKINLAEKFALFQETWTPKIVGQLNGQFIKLAKCEGRMVWHSHADEDEFFLVVAGTLVIHLRDRDVRLEAGEGFIVPRGVEHCPEAEGLAQVLLFEPMATAHTGELEAECTVAVEDQEWI